MTTQASTVDLPTVVESDLLRKLLCMVERVARGNVAVLILGETGSGKELIARAVHKSSMRATKPFIEINCAALPEYLVESELFGYEKGAFSGAESMKAGLFELADGGTLFLDEIGELDLKVQSKLLRVLDGAPFFRLGGRRKIVVDTRVIAATNRNLEHEVNRGAFRADLFHRIAQFQLRVPPLRERPEDILPLAQYFLARAGIAATISDGAAEALKSYEWRGNARELRNIILQAAVSADGKTISLDDLMIEVQGAAGKKQGTTPIPSSLSLDELERTAIERALHLSGGNQGLAAEKLGISRRTLLRKLKQYRTDPKAIETPLGQISPEQQKTYRSKTDLRALLHAGSLDIDVRVVNASRGGVAVRGVEDTSLLQPSCTIGFAVNGNHIEAECRLAWSDGDGNVGLQFTSMSTDCEQRLSAWLREEQIAEGWVLDESGQNSTPTA